MAILNKIRQRSLVLILVIAMALFAFVLADLFRNSDALSAKSQNVVATINGQDISREDFMRQVELAQQQLGANATSNQVMNRVYDQELRKAVLNTEYQALGLSAEQEQTRELIKQNLASYPEFQNADGVFDENKLNEFIANLRDISPEAGNLGGTAITYAGWIDFENRLGQNALQQTYFNMIKAGAYANQAEGMLEQRLEGGKADINYVQVPYASIADSTITVTDAEITNYINAHKKQYEVKATRDINFVEFNEVASAEDETELKNKLLALLNGVKDNPTTTEVDETELGFADVKDNKAFIDSNSDIKYADRFFFKKDLPKEVADTIYSLNVGKVYGPYKNSGYFMMSKVVEEANLFDSLKVRHILIPFKKDSTDLVNTKTEIEAKKTADSILSVVKRDKTKFPVLVAMSADKASIPREGVYDWHPNKSMVKEFDEFETNAKVGDMGVVKTEFGFHIIEMLGKGSKKRAIKVGTIGRKIEPSETTNDNVFRDASNFELAVGKGDFQEVAKGSNYAVRPVKGLKELDENIIGVGPQRQIVRWTFEEDVKVGDVKRFNIPGGYIIAQLTAKKPAGLMNVEDAKITVKPAILRDKKAQLIKDRVKATTLEDFAKAENKAIKTAAGVNMKTPTISGAGREPMIVGAAFGLKEGETSGVLQGNNGVYMIKVVKKEEAPKLDNYQGFVNQVKERNATAITGRVFNALTKSADIEDNRANTVQ